MKRKKKEKVLRFKKWDEPYIYSRENKSAKCRRYIVESMSPILNSLYRKVKERAKAEGIKKDHKC